MELREKHCWAEIDLAAAKNNFNLIKSTFKKPVYRVVKADAYGHGAKYMAKLYRDMGAYGLCVATFSEAMELRDSGITKPILILGYTDPTKAHELFKNSLTQTIPSLDYRIQLNAHSLFSVDCHIKLDTGMGRLGFDVAGDMEEALAQIKKLSALNNLRYSGVFTHFSAADSTGEKELIHTQKQQELFARAVSAMENFGIKPEIVHCQNSAGIARKLGTGCNAVRAGIILYGCQPSDEVVLPEIKPTMSLKTIVTNIKTIKAGQYVSYGMNYRADKDTVIATLAAGYADGMPRLAGFGGHCVQINGHSCPVVGNICMDQMMADVTGISVKVGDEVTVIGADGESSYEATAHRASTIPYELMCSVSKRVPRVYTEKGKILHIEYGI